LVDVVGREEGAVWRVRPVRVYGRALARGVIRWVKGTDGERAFAELRL
jgi:hypothetical protein